MIKCGGIIASVDDRLFCMIAPIKHIALGFVVLSNIIYTECVLEIKNESFAILYCTGKWRNNERNGCEIIDTIMHC